MWKHKGAAILYLLLEIVCVWALYMGDIEDRDTENLVIVLAIFAFISLLTTIIYAVSDVLDSNERVVQSNRDLENKLDTLIDKCAVLVEQGRCRAGDSVDKPTVASDEHQWRCDGCGQMISQSPCPHCSAPSARPVNGIETGNGEVKCPVCHTVQPLENRFCEKCGGEFMKYATAPYWCGKCGHEGSYEGDCPKCGSSMRRMKI